MSKEAVINLFKAGAEDRALHAQLVAADSPATVVKLAREKGYEFNEAEYTAVAQEMTQDKVELEDSELKAVAGGGNDQGWAERQQKLIERYGYDG
jgi:predicted ribosomally synthesized peptide with nif11-like leader